MPLLSYLFFRRLTRPHYRNWERSGQVLFASSDGTHMEGYFRDGDGNTHNDLNQEHGGGYIRSNPDENLNNNLG